ncbi:membrane hypothetical protein [Candidatus Propionivibrio aalborgensis]|uniref:Polysaccharide biosynthesis protein C-terminal domain-containing protein n=1 Tax=Candidatus Propionivibrio aalborgensis TaxID=1860101 RepID=A0A1A8XWG3_9RHOO|nr:membrane hypothetical protein [Candidatus Propionivibrio aalborgensis]
MAGLHFRNASWSGLAASIKAAAGLLSALLAIRLLGAGDYGHVATWLSLFVLYLSLNSSAFTMLVVRLMAAGSDAVPIDREAATAAAVKFSICSLAFLAAATVLLSALVVRLSLAGGEPPAGFGTVILLMGLLTAIQIGVALQAAIIEGAGRLDLATKWQLVGPLAVVAVLATSFVTGIAFRADAYLTLLCVGGAIDMTLLWNARGALGLSLSLSASLAGNSSGVLQLLRSGGLLQATSLLNVFLEPVNKFLLNHFTGSASVAIYDLAMKVIWGIQHLVGAAMRVFLHIGSQDSSAVGRTFVKAIALLGVPVVTMHTAGTLFLFGVARYWMAIDGTQLMILFGVATISNLGMIFVTPLYLSLIGRHDLIFIFRVQALLAVVNVLASCVAIPLFGLVGAAIGLLVATGLNVVAIYLRCRIEAEVFNNPEVPLLRTKRRVVLAIGLLVASIAWATTGGGQPLVLLAILAGLGVMMAGEPLVSRMIDQFIPGRT